MVQLQHYEVVQCSCFAVGTHEDVDAVGTTCPQVVAELASCVTRLIAGLANHEAVSAFLLRSTNSMVN